MHLPPDLGSRGLRYKICEVSQYHKYHKHRCQICCCFFTSTFTICDSKQDIACGHILSDLLFRITHLERWQGNNNCLTNFVITNFAQRLLSFFRFWSIYAPRASRHARMRSWEYVEETGCWIFRFWFESTLVRHEVNVQRLFDQFVTINVENFRGITIIGSKWHLNAWVLWSLLHSCPVLRENVSSKSLSQLSRRILIPLIVCQTSFLNCTVSFIPSDFHVLGLWEFHSLRKQSIWCGCLPIEWIKVSRRCQSCKRIYNYSTYDNVAYKLQNIYWPANKSMWCFLRSTVQR